MINHVITLLRNKHKAALPEVGTAGESYIEPEFTPVQLTGSLEELRALLVPPVSLELQNAYARVCDNAMRADKRMFNRHYPDPRIVYAPLTDTDIAPNFIVDVVKRVEDTKQQQVLSLIGTHEDLRTNWRAEEFPLFRFSALAYTVVIRMEELRKQRSNG